MVSLSCQRLAILAAAAFFSAALGAPPTCTSSPPSCVDLDACAEPEALARASAAEARAWREAAERLNTTVAESGEQIEALREAHVAAVREQSEASARIEALQASTAAQIEAEVRKAKAEVGALEARLARSELELARLGEQLSTRARSASEREAQLRRLQQNLDQAEGALNATATARFAAILEAAFASLGAGLGSALGAARAAAGSLRPSALLEHLRALPASRLPERAARLWLARPPAAADVGLGARLGLGGLFAAHGGPAQPPSGLRAAALRALPEPLGERAAALLERAAEGGARGAALLFAGLHDACARAEPAAAAAGAYVGAAAELRPLAESLAAAADLSEAVLAAGRSLGASAVVAAGHLPQAGLRGCGAVLCVVLTAIVALLLTPRLCASRLGRLLLRLWLLLLGASQLVGLALRDNDALARTRCAALAAAVEPSALPPSSAPMPLGGALALLLCALLLPGRRSCSFTRRLAGWAALGSLCAHAAALALVAVSRARSRGGGALRAPLRPARPVLLSSSRQPALARSASSCHQQVEPPSSGLWAGAGGALPPAALLAGSAAWLLCAMRG